MATMDEIRERYRELAQDFMDYLHDQAPSQGAGQAQAELHTVAPGQVLVIRLDEQAPPHMAADLARFLTTQHEAAGISVPVFVTLGASVTVQDEEN